MNLLSKLFFAATHPSVALSYLARRNRSGRLRESFPYNRPVQKLPGTIAKAQFFLKSFEKLPTQLLSEEAELILAGKRCLYGHARFEVDKKTNWQKDYLSGYCWKKNVFHEDIPYRYPQGTDIKSAWELSRLHHLVVVGRAYKATRENRYAIFVADELTDWIKNNHVYYGVNWKVAMEVGIRAANMLAAFVLIADHPVAKRIEPYLLGSMQDHGDYILNNLEVYGAKSNHYFADLCGLAWIGAYCRDLPHSSQYLSLAIRELNREVLHQFLPDGFGFEASVSYHRLVLEMLGFTLAAVGKEKFSSKTLDRAARAFVAAKAIMAPDGQSPQIGDNDSGRFFLTGQYFNWRATDLAHLGVLNSVIFPALTHRKAKIPKSFPYAGIELRARGRFWLCAATTPNGQDGNAGHNHDDNGSFTLWAGNLPLIVDPGTACYTSDPVLRNKFRSYRVHNGPIVDDKAPEPPGPQELFHGGRRVKGTMTSGVENISIVLRAPAFLASRKIKLDDHTVTITDKAGGNISVTLTLHPKVSVIRSGSNLRINKVTLSSNGHVALGKGSYSAAYATMEQTTTITLTAFKILTMRFTL